MTVLCKRCNQPKEVSATFAQVKAWAQGELIQNAMPNVPAEERELLISGYCGVCWDEIFKPKDNSLDRYSE